MKNFLENLSVSSDGTYSQDKDSKQQTHMPPGKCISTKSDQSMIMPIQFSNGPDRPLSRTSPVHNLFSPKTERWQNSDASPSVVDPEDQEEPGATQHRPGASRDSSSSCSLGSGLSGDRAWYREEPTESPAQQKSRRTVKQETVGLEISLTNAYKRRTKTIIEARTQTPFSYMSLPTMEGYSGVVNEEGKMASQKRTSAETHPDCCDVFTSSPHVRSILTFGIAGIGKTIAVQKFIYDWTTGLANQDVDLVILFSFRELNLMQTSQYSLLTLIHAFHPVLQTLSAETLVEMKVVFIMDSLDETKLPLNFQHNRVVSDVTETAPVDTLLTNLITGRLFPCARLWVTTRPVAAIQIPPECVDMVTEIRGFNHSQKEQYFTKWFVDDETLARRIISYVEASKSLETMCRIPVFCWVTATVLQHRQRTHKEGELPKTLTEIYAYFLLIQTRRKRHKYNPCATEDHGFQKGDRQVLLKLGNLAAKLLKNGVSTFCAEDLEECGLDVKQALVFSGLCTEIFDNKPSLFPRAVYRFVHLSIQGFLAAVYTFHCYTTNDKAGLAILLGGFGKKLNWDLSLDGFIKIARDEALVSETSHLDLFFCFLHDLALESNQNILRGLLAQRITLPKSKPASASHYSALAIKPQRSADNWDTYKKKTLRNLKCLVKAVGMNSKKPHKRVGKG